MSNLKIMEKNMSLKGIDCLSNKKCVYNIIVVLFIVSIFFSLIGTLTSFSFKSFIVLLLKFFIYLFIIFSFIVEIACRVKGYYELNNFYYKLFIWDSIFMVLLILLKKFNL